MRFGAEAGSEGPVILGNTIQNSLRTVSVGIVFALAFVAFRSADHAQSDSNAPARSGLQIDINQADDRELTLMPGIGTTTAQRIIANRRTDGPFRSIGDLQRVPGIGPKTVQRIKPYCKPIPDSNAK